MSDFVRMLLNGAGRMLDMSGSSIDHAYISVLRRRSERDTQKSLQDDMDAIGADMVKAINSVTCELPDVKKSKEAKRICH
jgi:hypothetical protein